MRIAARLKLAELRAETPAERRRQIAATARLLGRLGGGTHAVRARRARDVAGPGGAARELHLEADADGHRDRRIAEREQRRQRAVPRASAVKLSFRLPPTANAEAAADAVRRTLETDPPYGARVAFTSGANGGWNAPRTEPWLEHAVAEASRQYFGHEGMSMGVGGTIPFMAMLGERFPSTQFLVTGVLGPHSNAHGPNEFLHIDYAKRLTGAVADILARHAQR